MFSSFNRPVHRLRDVLWVGLLMLATIVASGCSDQSLPSGPTSISSARAEGSPHSESAAGEKSPPNLTEVDLSGLQSMEAASSCRRYQLVEGNFTQAQAWEEARRRGGHAAVLSSESEFNNVVRCFRLPRRYAIHIGHRQDPGAREPAGGWRTVTGERGYWPWNGKGPDDGCKNRFDWTLVESGLQLSYGPSCKNEDAATLWVDNGGRLEDVSLNHRGAVLVEFSR